MIRRAAPLLLLLPIAVVYFWRLGSMPVYLAPDEAIIANDAYAVAATGRALNGTFLPLYFQAGFDNNWFMPVIYYSIAGVLQVLPLAEWSIRVPTVLAGVLSIALVYLVGRRLGGDRLAALAGALALACAPAFFILSRYALDYTLPVPFILGWLWCLAAGLDSPRSWRWFAAAGLCLGAGWYAYISSIVMMPVYAVMTLAVLIARKRDWRDIAAFVAGFALPLTLFAVWLVQHPDAIEATVRRYALMGAAPPGGTPKAFDAGAMIRRHLNFFSFEFLFQLGDTYLPFSTRNAGVFVSSAAVLIGAGIFGALVTFRNAMTLLVLAGFVLSPLAASVLEDEGAIRRATGMLAFGALLAGLGAAQIRRITSVPFFRPLALTVAAVGVVAAGAVMARTALTQGRVSETAARVIVIAIAAAIVARLSPRVRHGALMVAPIVLLIGWQFVAFQRSYHGEYVSRLAPWLQGNIRGALERLIAEAEARPQAPVSLSWLLVSRGDSGDLRNVYLPHYWRFYVTKAGRQDVARRATFLQPYADLPAVPGGSLVLGVLTDPEMKRLIAAGAQRIADIPEIDREPSFTIVIR